MFLCQICNGRSVYLKKFPVSHCNFKGCNNNRAHSEGTLVLTDLFHQVHPLILRTMIQQDGHLNIEQEQKSQSIVKWMKALKLLALVLKHSFQ